MIFFFLPLRFLEHRILDKKTNANRIATGLENLAVHWGVKTQYESNIFDKLTLIAMTFENICNNIFISYF